MQLPPCSSLSCGNTTSIRPVYVNSIGSSIIPSIAKEPLPTNGASIHLLYMIRTVSERLEQSVQFRVGSKQIMVLANAESHGTHRHANHHRQRAPVLLQESPSRTLPPIAPRPASFRELSKSPPHCSPIHLIADPKKRPCQDNFSRGKEDRTTEREREAESEKKKESPSARCKARRHPYPPP